jgi:2-polyprenyl-6-methoxyphenol hydroxylase-like FAD-dependent oxidoreductase
LYSHIENKSKILTQKRVETVNYAEDKIEVVTTDGLIYSGDILVGADGVHSRVKQEMARVATGRGMPEHAEDDGT